jgi:putative flippase GtrA
MLSFSVIGVLGFLVDAGVLYVALFWDLGLYAGRAASSMSAASATWLLNRRHTFEQTSGNNKPHEWARFVVSQLLPAREPVIAVVCVIKNATRTTSSGSLTRHGLAHARN